MMNYSAAAIVSCKNYPRYKLSFTWDNRCKTGIRVPPQIACNSFARIINRIKRTTALLRTVPKLKKLVVISFFYKADSVINGLLLKKVCH